MLLSMVMVSWAHTQTTCTCYIYNTYITVAHHCPWSKQNLFTPSVLSFQLVLFVTSGSALKKSSSCLHTIYTSVCNRIQHPQSKWSSVSSQQLCPNQQNCCRVISYQAERTNKVNSLAFCSLSTINWFQISLGRDLFVLSSDTEL